jgi:hypothetical protein
MGFEQNGPKVKQRQSKQSQGRKKEEGRKRSESDVPLNLQRINLNIFFFPFLISCIIPNFDY